MVTDISVVKVLHDSGSAALLQNMQMFRERISSRTLALRHSATDLEVIKHELRRVGEDI